MAEDIKYQINVQLANNPLTPDNPNDVIAVPVSLGPADQQRILAEMKAEDSGLREETILHVFELEKRVIKRLLMSGYNVNTGLYYASVGMRGIVSGGQWNPEKNSIVVNFNVGADLREAIKNTTINIIGRKEAAISVSGVQDAATRAEDASATPGRAFTLTGRNIKLLGDDPSVGLTLINADGTETTIAQDLWVINDPSRVTFIIPADLEPGTYTLRLTTQYSGHSKSLLKSPRSIENVLYIGTTPPTTEGGSQGGSDNDNDDGEDSTDDPLA